MKFAKWLMVAACALLFCACSKSPLAYVDENADCVYYFNFSEKYNDDMICMIKQCVMPKGDLGFMSEFTTISDLIEAKAQLAWWESHGNKKAAIVLGDIKAEEFIDDCKSKWTKKNGKETGHKTSKVSVDDKDGVAFENGKYVYCTMVAVKNNTVLVIFGDKEAKTIVLPKAKNASKLAKAINEKSFYAAAQSEEMINELQKAKKKRGSWDENGDVFQVLKSGPIVYSFIIDGDDVKEIKEQDISDID